MAILDTLLFAMIAGLITLKVVLLAAAALLFLRSLTGRIRQRKIAPAALGAKHAGLNKFA
jgi:hypothetical protein